MNSSPAPTLLPTLDDIRTAARRIARHAVVTPLLESPLLNRQIGGRLLIKPEMLQRTGSFKFRGAFNRLSRMPAAARRRGVVAFSSGNHAQGVAAAAFLLGMPALIVMPADAPRAKLDSTRAWGAEVVFYDRQRDNREAMGARLAEERGATLVKPYDDPLVIAGQGTAGLELCRQAAALGAPLDAVLVPCGGGGLTAGTALSVAGLSPATAVHAVEPEGFDDTRRSLVAGERLSNAPDARSICDALGMPTPGEMTFAINRRRLKGAVAVDDEAALRAMAALHAHFKLVAEPSGAVALAAVLSGRFDARGKTVAVICSGGNVDPPVYRQALDRAG